MKTLFQPFPTLFTPRLQLRKLRLEDAPEIFIQRSDPRMLEFIEINVSKTLDDARQFIEMIHSNAATYWAIALKDKQALIGTICLWNLSEENASAELGYALNPDAQGHGYMQEAFQAVVAFGFDVMAAQKLEAHCHPKNLRSIRLLEKHHFMLTGEKDGYSVFEQRAAAYDQLQAGNVVP